jgi:hypothetical protein
MFSLKVGFHGILSRSDEYDLHTIKYAHAGQLFDPRLQIKAMDYLADNKAKCTTCAMLGWL